ncbi:MAG: tRNA (adenosine(37)-N6)-dimethylallyltransferase MiaA [bacterium]
MTAELVVICGPTAAGKTGAAIRVCAAVDGEVVSADAVQIYRHLDIGSAKPTREERAAAPHHVIDVVDPTERYSAARYIEDAERAIADIRSRGRRPVVTGGCGLYIKALLYGLCPAPPADPDIRAELEQEAEDGGAGTLHRRLRLIDPSTAERLHPADRVRVVRALEVYLITGRPISEHQAEHGFHEARHRAVVWGLDPGPEPLRERIDARVDQMMAEGFLEEVSGLLDRGYEPSSPGLSSPGYRELVAHLAGELKLDEAIRLIGRSHRHYARRQRTWFRKTIGLTWYSGADALPLGLLGQGS